MRTAVRIGVIAGACVVLAGWVTLTVWLRGTFWLVSLPVVGAVWLLVCLDCGYLLGRELAHRSRRRSSRQRRRAWEPDASVRRPIDYPYVLGRPTGEDPVDHQGRFRAKGIRLAALPALAVVFLTVQTVFLDDSRLGVGFVCAECLLLFWMVWTVWTEQDPSRPWVTSRVRAELFRREMFLLLTAVGPYLDRSGQETERIRDARLARLAAADLAELLSFGRLGDLAPDGSERDWRDDLWRRRDSADVTDPAALAEVMRTYLDHRIRRQALFLELAAEKCDSGESITGRIAKAAVLGAVGVAMVYGALLVAGRDGQGPSTAASAVALLAAGFPPLCNLALAVQNLLASQRLAVSYRETRRELLEREQALGFLLADAARPGAEAEFRALVLRTEATLGEENRRWRIIVAKPEFDAGL
ncbi:hypothetical protein AB0D38_00655 [Streptomyces sp. NPDC048279]|uniref:hypothetical protein n=1 Tax=Streptomyces sp. NPDC048279 TaxID=3154714 RepID=UPI00344839D4